MSLHNLWFVIDALFWVGFFVLEGFDFGVGMLHSFVGRTDEERRVAVNTIGPFWDGNEVWLIVAGAVIFAAFPSWYATMFSTFYLALVVVLLALMLRGVAFEYQRKVDDPRWRAWWRWSLTLGSLLIPLLVGVALGDLLHGLPINAQHQYTGNFFDLLVPYGLWTGITFVVVSLFLGAAFLRLKTRGALRERVAALAPRIGWAMVFVVWGFVTWTHLQLGKGFIPNPIEVVAVLAAVAAAWLAGTASEGWTFLCGIVTMAASVGTIFAELYPNVMVSTTKAAYTLTIVGTASGSYALKVMTIVAVIFFPLVLLYQAWNFYVFRARLTAPPAATPGAPEGAPATRPAETAEVPGAPGGDGAGPGDES